MPPPLPSYDANASALPMALWPLVAVAALLAAAMLARAAECGMWSRMRLETPRRATWETAFLLVLAVAAVQHGGTKNAAPSASATNAVCGADGRAGRPALPDGQVNGISAGRDVAVAPCANDASATADENAPSSESASATSAIADDAPGLRFTGIERSGGSTILAVAWPAGTSFAGGAVDLLAGAGPAAADWRRVARIDVSGAVSNGTAFALPDGELPESLRGGAAFFRLSARTGGDGAEAVDTDGDGIPDEEETGRISESLDFEWHDASGFETLRHVPPAQSEGISSWECAKVVAPISSEHVVCGRRLTTLVAFETGYVAFCAPGDFNGWVFPPGPRPLDLDVGNSGSLMVAPYWCDSRLAEGDADSYVRHGTAADGSFVVEFGRVRCSSSSDARLTYQVVVPPGTGDVLRVSHLESDFALDGSNAVVGVQNTTVVTADGYCNLTYDFAERGPIPPRTTLEFHLGFGTDPAKADTDGDGLSDWQEARVLGTSPTSADTDGDGVADGRELALGLDPKSADTDEDGLTDGREVELGLDPKSADTDGDGLTDGREVELGLDPKSSDTDGDGLSDGLEASLGLNPLQPDTDGDCMDDGWEHRHRSAGFDPAVDGADDGNPDNDSGADPDGDGLTNGQECEWRTDPSNADTDGDGVGDGAEVAQGSDPTDGSDGGRPGARVPVPFHFGDPSGSHSEKYRLDVTPVSGPGGTPASFSWLNGNYGECETRTAMLKPGWRYEVRLRWAACSPTSGTCSASAAIPLSESDFLQFGDHSEIRVSRTRAQLAELGLLPLKDDDGVDEMAWMDVGSDDPNQNSNLEDSEAFSRIGYAFRGKATNGRKDTLESTPPNSAISKSFFKAAGCEVVRAEYGGVRSRRRQIMNQADVFYYSGHGHHLYKTVDPGFDPGDVGKYWGRDLSCVVFSACSILDVNDYNNNYRWEPDEHSASPGKAWEAVGPSVMLGYNYYAPSDKSGAPTRIISNWIETRKTMGDVNAWMNANRAQGKWNACAIQKGVKYVYFEKFPFRIHIKREVPKEKW